MAGIWDGLKTGIRGTLKDLSEKTDELTRMGKLKIEIVAVKRDIEKKLLELGGRVYHLMDSDQKPEIDRDNEIEKLVAQIKTKENKLQELEERIADIRDQKQRE